MRDVEIMEYIFRIAQTAVLPTNQMPGLNYLLTNIDLNIEISY